MELPIGSIVVPFWECLIRSIPTMNHKKGTTMEGLRNEWTEHTGSSGWVGGWVGGSLYAILRTAHLYLKR